MKNLTRPQFYTILLLRLVIGYHFLYEGFNKLFAEAWSSGGFLIQSNWILSEFFISMANSPAFITVADFLNIWGQIFIGLGLILGLFTRFAAYSAAFLLLLYYIAYPPFVESYVFVDRNLLEFIGALIVALFPTAKTVGLDGLIWKDGSSKNG
jgi:thiosulfate dehydrogenase [quinone] large subunit